MPLEMVRSMPAYIQKLKRSSVKFRKNIGRLSDNCQIQALFTRRLFGKQIVQKLGFVLKNNMLQLLTSIRLGRKFGGAWGTARSTLTQTLVSTNVVYRNIIKMRKSLVIYLPVLKHFPRHKSAYSPRRSYGCFLRQPKDKILLECAVEKYKQNVCLKTPTKEFTATENLNKSRYYKSGRGLSKGIKKDKLQIGMGSQVASRNQGNILRFSWSPPEHETNLTFLKWGNVEGASMNWRWEEEKLTK